MGSTMKLVKNTKLFVDFTNIMVVHIMNNEIGCFNQFVLREYHHMEVFGGFSPEAEIQLVNYRSQWGNYRVLNTSASNCSSCFL